MIEVTLDSIAVSSENYQKVVLLKEKTGERYLPISIGSAEANAIVVKVQGVAVPRPLTHDLIRSVIELLGASIDCIAISGLENDTFYAKIILNVTGQKVEVDSRPSDSLALAIRVGAPILAEESVLDEASILLDKETGRVIPADREKQEMEGRSKEVSQEELKRMSAFTDFINTLNLDNLDKRQSIPQAYCMKCRQKREIKDPKQITLKNGSQAVQGTCPICGTKVFRIGKL